MAARKGAAAPSLPWGENDAAAVRFAGLSKECLVQSRVHAIGPWDGHSTRHRWAAGVRFRYLLFDFAK
jgi:hypothetical protein